VAGAHGIRGEVKVHSFAESIALYQVGDIIRIDLTDGGIYKKTISSVKPHGRGLLMGFVSVTDRSQAERLTGGSLYMDKSKLPTLEEDTYYWADLLGLKVVDRSGCLLGVLDEVIPTPGNDVYVVKGDKSGDRRELLIPAIGQVVVSVDLKEKTMIVDPPEGL
jgi:16S rRNA processing protein RimM